MPDSAKRGPVGFRIIGAFKLLGALLLVGAGVGVFRLLGRDVGGALEDIAATFRIDAQNHYIHSAISWASGIDRAHLRAIGVGTFCYAALYGAEGTGLVLGKTWGGYLTAVATGSLIPVEIWEVAHRPEPKRITVLILNLAVLAYVVWKLVQERRAAKSSQGPLLRANREGMGSTVDGPQERTLRDHDRGSTPSKCRTKKSRRRRSP